jgi:hypothetical protein
MTREKQISWRKTRKMPKKKMTDRFRRHETFTRFLTYVGSDTMATPRNQLYGKPVTCSIASSDRGSTLRDIGVNWGTNGSCELKMWLYELTKEVKQMLRMKLPTEEHRMRARCNFTREKRPRV